jgi:iron complex transport system substrate-binding protein
MITILKRGGVVLASVLLLSACSASSPETSADSDTSASATRTTYPLTVETCGKSITLDRAPVRAVALEQSQTEFMLSLGLEKSMIGTSYLTDPVLPALEDAYATVPVLAEKYPSHEVMLGAAPDFIYASGPWSVADDAAGSRDRWAALDVPVYMSSLACDAIGTSDPGSTFDGIFAEIRTVAEIFDVQDAGEAMIAEQQAAIDDAVASAPADLDDVSFIWWYTGTTTPYLGGKGSAADDFAGRLGISNDFADGAGRWSEASWEAIAADDPDVIVLADLTRGFDGDSAQAKIDYLKSNPLTSELSAVKNERFVVVPGSARDRSVRTVTSFEALSAGLSEYYGK